MKYSPRMKSGIRGIFVEHLKDYHIWLWQFRAWLETGTKKWQGYM